LSRSIDKMTSYMVVLGRSLDKKFRDKKDE